MGKAHCRTVMFGVERGSQTVLDWLKKEQTLADVARAVTTAKQAGIEIVHGFFVVGTPDERSTTCARPSTLRPSAPLIVDVRSMTTRPRGRRDRTRKSGLSDEDVTAILTATPLARGGRTRTTCDEES
jgi:hypothetical protein